MCPDADQHEMASLVEFERSLCDGCKQRLDESSDPMRSFAIEKDFVCYGCQRLAEESRDLAQKLDPKGEHPERLAGYRLHIVGSRKWSDADVAAYHERQMQLPEGGGDGA